MNKILKNESLNEERVIEIKVEDNQTTEIVSKETFDNLVEFFKPLEEVDFADQYGWGSEPLEWKDDCKKLEIKLYDWEDQEAIDSVEEDDHLKDMLSNMVNAAKTMQFKKRENLYKISLVLFNREEDIYKDIDSFVSKEVLDTFKFLLHIYTFIHYKESDNENCYRIEVDSYWYFDILQKIMSKAQEIEIINK